MCAVESKCVVVKSLTSICTHQNNKREKGPQQVQQTSEKQRGGGERRMRGS